jgi:hypothetical protein
MRAPARAVAGDTALGPSPQSIARPTSGSRLRLSNVAGRVPGRGSDGLGLGVIGEALPFNDLF